MPNVAVARDTATRADTLITWMAVHGALCLALRHPNFRGPTRGLVVRFVEQLGELLVARGLLTAEELAYAKRVEREEARPLADRVEEALTPLMPAVNAWQLTSRELAVELARRLEGNR